MWRPVRETRPHARRAEEARGGGAGRGAAYDDPVGGGSTEEEVEGGGSVSEVGATGDAESDDHAEGEGEAEEEATGTKIERALGEAYKVMVSVP